MISTNKMTWFKFLKKRTILLALWVHLVMTDLELNISKFRQNLSTKEVITLTKFYNGTYLILQQQIKLHNTSTSLPCPVLIHTLKTDMIQFHKIILGSARTQQSSCW